MIQFISESHFAQHFSDRLTEAGWSMYPEVQGIDLVGVCPEQRLYAIECKMDLTLGLVKQCWKRLPYANAVIAAVPSRYISEESFEATTLRLYGVGIWTAGHVIKKVLAPTQREIQDLGVKNVLVKAAMGHTAPGLPSCRSWGHWDVLQEKYVEFIQAAGRELTLHEVIANVEPELRGKRVLVLQQHFESRQHLILCGRWRKLEFYSDHLVRVRA